MLPHPIFCRCFDFSFLRPPILCHFDFEMNNDSEEDKKRKIHFIFSVNKIPVCTPASPSPSSELSLIQGSVTGCSLEPAPLCLLSLQEMLLPLTA